jgi:outer membrane protein assembly factor BamB
VDGFFYALNPDGGVRWRLHTGGITESSPVIGADGMIYVGVHNFLWAISPDGKRQWERALINFVEVSPTVLTDNSLCVVSHQGDLLILDKEHQPRWYWEQGSFYGHASPTIGADGALYAQYRCGLFFAFETKLALAESPWPKFRGNSRNTGNARDVKR